MSVVSPPPCWLESVEWTLSGRLLASTVEKPNTCYKDVARSQAQCIYLAWATDLVADESLLGVRVFSSRGHIRMSSH